MRVQFTVILLSITGFAKAQCITFSSPTDSCSQTIVLNNCYADFATSITWQVNDTTLIGSPVALTLADWTNVAVASMVTTPDSSFVLYDTVHYLPAVAAFQFAPQSVCPGTPTFLSFNGTSGAVYWQLTFYDSAGTTIFVADPVDFQMSLPLLCTNV